MTGADRDIEATFREKGLRVTRPRVLVYRKLRELGGHRSVDEIVGALAREGELLPRMTVYNVISNLAAVQLVMRADAGPGRALYEVGGQWHHHFVCRTCSDIRDVPCVVGSRPCLEPDVEGGVVEEAQVIFRGLCPACAAKGPA